VLDFGRYIAGPWCAALLGDFGADVIRIDKVGGSEDRSVLPVGGGLDGALYLQMNRNKRSMTLGARGEQRDEILRRLIMTSDVVVANMPDSALKALGIDYDALAAVKPDIILTSVSAFGEGPLSDKVGFDMMAQAMSGAMHLTGHADEPMRSSVSWADFGTATLCALGTMAAILERKQSGKGQHVRGSLLATAVMTANSFLIEQALTSANRTGTANRSQLAAPADLFRTSDGHIVMQAVGNVMFRRWARLVGAEDWIDDPRFASDQSRAEHGELLSGRMQAWCADKSTKDVLDALETVRLPGAEVLTPQQALDHPQIAAAGLFSDVCRSPGGDVAPVVSTPVFLSRTPGTVRSPAPENGAHTAEILAELGWTACDIDGLVAAGAV
jgi:crotonobetainyl-CoA:carnitine CoA-transferase CaiB-like acyl-CoA transferase